MAIVIIEQVAQELTLLPGQVQRAVELLDDDNTIPFITRYRKEATGGLDEVQLEVIRERVDYLRNLHQRQEEVRRSIDEQGQLNPDLADRIASAWTLQELEDLYLPFRPKRRTRASIAREKGLAPLADLILAQDAAAADRIAAAVTFLSTELELHTPDDALAGARDIVSEMLAEDADVRKDLRQVFQQEGAIQSRVADAAKDRGRKYEMYYDLAEPLAKMPPHRLLAINRGEAEGVLKASVDLPWEAARPVLQRHHPVAAGSAFAEDMALCHEDSYKRLLGPSLERETRSSLTEAAEKHAIGVFAVNLRHLLLQPPLRGRTVMGIDPGYVTGCKVAVVDETGRYLEGVTVYPHQPQRRWEEAKRAIAELARRHSVDVLAIGNGTASRESEALAAEVIAELGEEGRRLAYAIVSEAGASVYSASEVARREFPDLEASQRGNISIARRLQDPLAELVRIDPKSIGVGLYQHGVDQKELGRALDTVVTSCVNHVGVDLNTASASLLQYVSGINKRVAESIVKYRDENGKLRDRRQIKRVSGLGEKAFQQSAGFLKIPDGDNPLDNTFIHPESYGVAEALVARIRQASPEGHLPAATAAFRSQMPRLGLTVEKLAAELGTGAPTLSDILDNLERPGRDPREQLPPPILRTDVLKMEDLQEGMVLKGTVRNVVDFGAFVDIGVKQDGLVHISQMKDGYVSRPTDVVAAGDVVTVRVLSVDLERGRIALSMKGVPQD